jgi:GNAT superfamily N-acetyltransferase
MIMMPKLEEERVYHRDEVAAYIGTQEGSSDYTIAELRFPRNLKTWEPDVTAWRDGEEILLQYTVFPMEDFKEQLGPRLAECWERKNDEWNRVERIVEILENGNPFFPVLMQKNDRERRIVEGHHRSMALLSLESDCLPAFLLGYRNWFIEDELLPAFKQEDEIAPGTKKEVLTFFRHANCIDQMGMMPALLDRDRLMECDNVLVARYRGKVVGAVTMSVRKAALETVYVLKQYRRKGTAYRLCEHALLRMRDLGVASVLCDVQSKGMMATLNRLAVERPDLRAMVALAASSNPSDDLEHDWDDLFAMRDEGEPGTPKGVGSL